MWVVWVQFTAAWWIATVIFYGFSLKLAYETMRDMKRAKGAAFVATLVICVAILNGASYLGSRSHDDPPQMRANDVTTMAFDLESGHPYDLVVSSQLGNTGTIDLNTSFFSSRASAKVGTSLLIDFTHKACLLAEDVDFIQKEGVKPTVTIHLTSGRNFGFMGVESEGPCETIIESGFLACQHVITYKPVISQVQKDVSRLPTIVKENFNKAEITLPPQLFKQVFGFMSS